MFDVVGWKSSAMLYIALHHDSVDMIIKFLTDLERVSIFLGMELGVNIVTKRFKSLINSIKKGEDLYSPESPLQLTPTEKKNFLRILEGDMYHKDICPYILLKLDEHLAATDEAKYTYNNISIEHILPQNPKNKSTWMEWFPNAKERVKYTNCLGNLVLLSKSKNSEAQNYDFKEKNKNIFSQEEAHLLSR